MRAIVAALGWAVFLAVAISSQNAGPAKPTLHEATFSQVPIYFIENRGVYPDEVAYYVEGADKTLFFTKSGITFRLKEKGRAWVVKLEFPGANPDVVPRGADKQQAVLSYFRGPKKDWKTGLRTYAMVVYEELWPGIDLIYHGRPNHLKYELRVAAGADPSRIRLRYCGASSVTATDSGTLKVETPEGSFEDAPPEAWQEIDGKRVPVKMSYRLERDHEFGFHLGDYDRSLPLVLDPAVLVRCGYIGGSGNDQGYGIAVDPAGNAYVVGTTYSNQGSYPVKVGPDLTYNGFGQYAGDAFVAKVNAAGTAFVYCGYIGGAGSDWGYDVAVDAAGNAYVTGWTDSNEQTFPVTVGPDLTYNGGSNDAFVAKVNAQGTGLVYCGYIGGASNEIAGGVAVNAAGNAYVTGWTKSSQQTFPVAVGPDLTYNTGDDAFVAKVNAAGTALDYCGYIGGNDYDSGNGIAVDAAGNAYVTGTTAAKPPTFPLKVGPDLTFNGGHDAFVAKVNPQGTALVSCGYIGGSGHDSGSRIAVDAAGNAYVTGGTQSTERTFPVTVGPDLTYNDNVYYVYGDAFVAKVNAQGNGLAYCGYIGGIAFDVGYGIAVDASGYAYVMGHTASSEMTFPVKDGTDLTHNGGTHDAFVAKVDRRGTALVYCGYVGGTGADEGAGIAVDAVGNAYVTGRTGSDEKSLPVTVGPDLTHNGGQDAFVAKVALAIVQGSGAPRPGGAVNLLLTDTDGSGRAYRMGTSLGTGPIPIDTRKLDLSPDVLLVVSTGGVWPSIFSGYRGVIDAKGQAQATIRIPNIPALIGLRLHSAFVTLDPAAPSGIRSISSTFSFSITK